jgi:predicted membrane protein|tara:strand:+ start:542 stop:742 length:201 start_codon:yes stop_codon:yes gene_type:complete
MINFILFVTVLGVWVGAVYLYFVLDRLMEDVREINKDIVECKAMMQRKIEQENERTEITNDEFLGI